MLLKLRKMLLVTISISISVPIYAQETISYAQQIEEGIYDRLALHFIEYEALDANGNTIELMRIGRAHDGGYVVPVQALYKAEALLGYGIANDISFEEDFCYLTQKPAYAFDGGIPSIAVLNPLCSFFPECIGNDKFLYRGQRSSGKISTFSEQIARLGLEENPVFIKMDIEGAEYDCFEDILSHAQQITGIVVEIHFLTNPNFQPKAEVLLNELEKDFVLVHLHANNCARGSVFESRYVAGKIPFVVELTYINKNLLSSYNISSDQKHPKSIDMKNDAHGPDCCFQIFPPAYFK